MRATPPGEADNPNVADAGGFSLHAGFAAQPDQRAKLERLCRYVARPAVAEGQLALTTAGARRSHRRGAVRDVTPTPT